MNVERVIGGGKMTVVRGVMAAVVLVGGVGVVGVRGDDAAGKGAPAAAAEGAKPVEGAKPEAAAAPAAAVDMAAMNVLDRLEAADKDLKSLSATIQYVRQFPEIQGGGSHTWRGELKFQNEVAAGKDGKEGKPTRRFAVDFRETIVDGKKRDERQTYVFDGQWLLTENWAEKQFSRYELVRDGEGQDPMKLGEGPLPLPIGQKKADMVERFVVSVPGVLEGIGEGEEFADLRRLLEKTTQIKLTPREGTREAKDFREIRVWYRSGDWLPIFAQSVNTDETKAEVLLVGLARNVEVGAKDFSTKPQEGWTGESRRRPGAEAAPASGAGAGGVGAGVKKPG